MALLIGYFGKLDLAPGKFPDARFSRIRFWATLITVSCAVVFGRSELDAIKSWRVTVGSLI